MTPGEVMQEFRDGATNCDLYFLRLLRSALLTAESDVTRLNELLGGDGVTPDRLDSYHELVEELNTVLSAREKLEVH